MNCSYVTNYNIWIFYLYYDAGHEISHEYDGNFELSNIIKILKQVNEDKSIGKIGKKIINLIVCTLSHCTLYIVIYMYVIYWDEKNNV